MRVGSGMRFGAALSLFTMELRKVLAYRVDFWVQFLGAVISQFAVAYFLWSAVFKAQGVSEIGGYQFNELMFYYLLVPLVDRLNRGHDTFVLSREIYDGSLTRYLVYPISFFSYRYIGTLSRASLSLVQLAIGVAAFTFFYGLPETYVVSLKPIFMGLGICAIAMVCYFFLSSIVEMVAFWADHVWSLMVMLRFVIQLLGGALLPLELYPDWAQAALVYTPFPYIVAVPVRLFIGQAGMDEFSTGVAVLSVWTLVFYIGAALVWCSGTKSYTGVGI